MIDFPASPTLNQQFSAAGVSWVWDGSKWMPSGLAPTIVGGINDNRIINGDMRIDQRNNGASGTAAGYTVDRWLFSTTQVGKLTWGRVTLGPGALAAAGFGYALSFSVASVYTPVAADNFSFVQPIEADMVADLAWGSVNAQPVTLSFWVSSSLTGTFSGALRNNPAPATRSYPFTFSIPTANTWTKIVVTIPGDTAGTWVLQGNAAGVTLGFDLGMGSNFRGSAGAWAAANYWGVTGAVSFVANAGVGFNITGVKLEIGVATPFNRQSLTKSLADCQRYFQSWQVFASGYNAAGNNTIGPTCLYPVVMRAAPTATLNSPSYANGSAISTNAVSSTQLRIQWTMTATGFGWAAATNATLDAEL